MILAQLENRAYFDLLEHDVFWRSISCRDKGMGPPTHDWHSIADHLWNFYSEHRESWPGPNEEAPPKETFFNWVQSAVKDYDAGSLGSNKWWLAGRRDQGHDV